MVLSESPSSPILVYWAPLLQSVSCLIVTLNLVGIKEIGLLVSIHILSPCLEYDVLSS